jgi:hypothetical protein
MHFKYVNNIKDFILNFWNKFIYYIYILLFKKRNSKLKKERKNPRPAIPIFSSPADHSQPLPLSLYHLRMGPSCQILHLSPNVSLALFVGTLARRRSAPAHAEPFARVLAACSSPRSEATSPSFSLPWLVPFLPLQRFFLCSPLMAMFAIVSLSCVIHSCARRLNARSHATGSFFHSCHR